ncbi:MAG: SAM-dependent methyltransferase [Halobacteriovorax sp.]|nr:SAM-dependent methyltransferase [Halobacteriovorax sp.]|tara:strand:+ start:89 stop:790 length:702 start_codon:yes stop_codon:yes gene_type:complete
MLASFKPILVLFIFITSAYANQRSAINAKRYEALSGIREAESTTNKDGKVFWDSKYSDTKYVFGKKPAKFLAQNYDFIPSESKVLDMGMGEGRNAVFLARKGYKVTGIDISSVAVKKAKMLADEYGVRINTVVASMNKYKIQDGAFDAIICFYYVDRALHERMLSWLKPGGILIYESHTDLQKTVKGSERYDQEYLLRPSELLSMFKGMKILKYEEPLHTGEFTASIILKKPE